MELYNDHYKYFNNLDELNQIKNSPNQTKVHKEIIEALKYLSLGKVLDVGERNPLTIEIEEAYNIKVDNTVGDLDFEVKAPSDNYSTIVFSHVIEHLMNPLFVLEQLKLLLKNDGYILIAHPVRKIKGKHHFHEIPIADLKNLIKKAGMKVQYIEGFTVKAKHTFGIRPLIRLFTSRNDRNYITVVKK